MFVRCLSLFLFIVGTALFFVSCQPDPIVNINTNTPRPPAVSLATNTPLPSDTPSLTPSLTPTETPVTPSSTPSPTWTFTPSDTPTATATPTATFTRTPYPTKVLGATYTPMPALPVLNPLPEPHLWLARPIGEKGINYIERNYPYGNTENGMLRPHHGVEFFNPLGTPILAAAEGAVVFAGPDIGSIFIGPQSNFYGNVVVIEHAQSINGQPVFSLYGHMSSVEVVPGQFIHTGQEIGKVGGTGVALGGTHLHFEVRVGYNDYYSTRNPELWLKPFTKWGTLVGRVADRNGILVPLAAIAIRSEKLTEGTFVSRYLTTYAAETVNPDPAYGENFVVMDLPPGTYSVQVGTTKTYTQTVVIKPDQISWIEFANVNPPPTWTPTPTGTRYTSTPQVTLTATCTSDSTGGTCTAPTLAPTATETPKP